MSLLPTKKIPEAFCRELARIYQFYRMYPSGSDNVSVAAGKAASMIEEYGAPVRFTRMDEEYFVEDTVLVNPPRQVTKLFDVFSGLRWESLKFDPSLGASGILAVFDRMDEGIQGPYNRPGFAAGAVGLDDDDEDSDKFADEGAGYLIMMPMVQEFFSDVKSGRKGSWLRAHDIVRTLGDYMMAGSDIFAEVSGLKDYDEYTFTHALNVAMVSVSMARAMKVSDNITDTIAMGALCHDLGKKAVPIEVLNKPSKLSAEEKAVMDKHPVSGAAKIMAVQGGCPPLVPVIAFEHHMKADGTGYPRMPVLHTPHPASLLVSVADTFDAIRTRRPYQKKEFSQADGLSILVRLATEGSHPMLFVSVLARLLGVLVQGCNLKLDDGRKAVVISEGEFDALQPLLETEDMEILDLSIPGSPGITEIYGVGREDSGDE